MSSFLYEELTNAGFLCKESEKNILVVENFLLDEELEHLLDIIKNTPEEDWLIEYTSNLKNFCMEKFGRDDVDNLVAEGKFEITQGWQDKNLSIQGYEIHKKLSIRLSNLMNKINTDLELNGFATIQRMQKGTELKAHTDQHTDPSIRYAAIIYLNDNYVDGELFFVNKDITLRPNPGSLVIFPGNDEYNHGVKHVGDGPIRYVIVGFIKVKNFYKDNKY